jgi:hypothetical protein
VRRTSGLSAGEATPCLQQRRHHNGPLATESRESRRTFGRAASLLSAGCLGAGSVANRPGSLSQWEASASPDGQSRGNNAGGT